MSISNKTILLGDAKVGKSCLMWSYTSNAFPDQYIPTVYETPRTNILIDDQVVTISIFDTSANEVYDRLRPLCYPGTSVFLLCFTYFDPNSLQSIVSRWVPEITEHCPDTPYFLVGLKADLLQDENTRTQFQQRNIQPITDQEANEVKKQIGAIEYLKCSALTQQGLRELFDCVARMGLGIYKQDLYNSYSWIKKKLYVELPKLPKFHEEPIIHPIQSNFKEQVKDLLLIHKKTRKKEQGNEKEKYFSGISPKYSWDKTRYGDVKFFFEITENGIQVKYTFYAHKLILSERSKLFFRIFQELKNKETTQLNDLLQLAGLTIIEKTSKNKDKKKILCFLVHAECETFLELIKFIYFSDFIIFQKEENCLKFNSKDKFWLDQINKYGKSFGISGIASYHELYSKIYHHARNEQIVKEKIKGNIKEKIKKIENEKGEEFLIEKETKTEIEKETEKEKETETEKETEIEIETDNQFIYKLKKEDLELLDKLKNEEWKKIITTFKECRKHIDFIDFVIMASSEKEPITKKNLKFNFKKKNKKISQPVGLPVNKFILAMKSNYFKTLLGGGMLEEQQDVVDLSQFPIFGMKYVIEYLYSEMINGQATTKELQAMLVIADYIQSPILKRDLEICLSGFLKYIKDDEVIEVFLAARASDAEHLLEYCVWFLGKKYDQIKKNSKYKKWLTNEEKNMIKNKMWPPENYRRLQNQFKVKLAKQFGYIDY
ncbi:gtp-binding protein rho5 [Anaeramoeba flamelloides]|uniref:Gtp-binding protein rho5 n=1 Tax=Anaeramoeba flamelloides TaxID=1746091 RepID=A0AAV7Y119_9EUKA|nr:gtp-binding protein rho5 [Anaeramoeba flamelloides]